MPLKLSIGSLSVTFDKFTNTDYPRIRVNPATLEYSAHGNPALGGAYFEQKHLWNFTCHCDRTQRNLIEAIEAEFNYRRRNLLDSDILLEDTTSLLVERAPISRGIVENTVTDSIAEGYICYYAKFKTAITDGPKFVEQGRLDILSLTLAETIKVAA